MQAGQLGVRWGPMLLHSRLHASPALTLAHCLLILVAVVRGGLASLQGATSAQQQQMAQGRFPPQTLQSNLQQVRMRAGDNPPCRSLRTRE